MRAGGAAGADGLTQATDVSVRAAGGYGERLQLVSAACAERREQRQQREQLQLVSAACAERREQRQQRECYFSLLI